MRNLLAMIRLGAVEVAALELDRGLKLYDQVSSDLESFAERLKSLMASLQVHQIGIYYLRQVKQL